MTPHIDVTKDILPQRSGMATGGTNSLSKETLDWFDSFDNGSDINARGTWTEENLPWSFKNGMYPNFYVARENTSGKRGKNQVS
ncbi:hypothetical protein BJX63DRAFT_433278 [Aspergillus granulosus]|uniref:Uncharacterized protein n=1 Tax=Aspergillus granulosus TaxID=176169 RepID=A0ABR4H8G4_9EURO